MGYCKQHDAYNGNGHCPHCSSEFNRDNSATIDRLIRERDEARAEVERLKAEYNETLQMAANQAVTIKEQINEIERLRRSVEDWHDAAVRAERNAAMSQEETLSHIDRIAALMDEAERLRECDKYACDVADNLRAEIKTLRNQAVANTEDAERYRWLRTEADMIFGPFMNRFAVVQPTTFSNDEIDAAIDTAMRESE